MSVVRFSVFLDEGAEENAVKKYINDVLGKGFIRSFVF